MTMPCGATEARASYERGQDRETEREKRAEPYLVLVDRLKASRDLIRATVARDMLLSGDGDASARLPWPLDDLDRENLSIAAIDVDGAYDGLIAEAQEKADAIMRGNDEE